MRLAADAVAVALRCMQQMLQIRQLSCICTSLDVAHKLWYHFLYAPWTGHLNDPRKGIPIRFLMASGRLSACLILI